MHAQAFTPEQVAGIVREVLRRIGAGVAPPPRQVPPAPVAPAVSVPGAGFVLGERIVTAASLAVVPTGTSSVTVRHDALITPSARDAARAAGFALTRGSKEAGAKPGATAATPPFFIAAAECPGDAAGRTAGLVRALPGAQQLPSTGLGDVVATLGLHLTRDGGRAILLAGRPHVAVALANRSPGVRAVTARDTTALLAAAGECGANLLVVAPRDFSAVSLERVGVTLATRGAGAPPAELAPAGCPCGGKPDAPAKASPCSCKHH